MCVHGVNKMLINVRLIIRELFAPNAKGVDTVLYIIYIGPPFQLKNLMCVEGISQEMFRLRLYEA